MHILITGGAGFLGSNLTERYLVAGHDVCIIDNFATGHRGSLPDSHQDEARQRYLEEGTPLRPSGSVDIKRASWRPPALRARPAPAGRSPREA